jgi:hypothetical protein
MMLSRVLLGLCAALLWVGAAFGQASSTGAVPTQETATNLRAATGIQSTSPAINAQSTLTIPASSGNYAYITMIEAGACMSGAASVSDVNKSWTTTNLQSLTFQTSVISGSTVTTNAGALLCDRHIMTFPGGLKSAVPGTAVTIVSPTANAQVAYPSMVTYYYAP